MTDDQLPRDPAEARALADDAIALWEARDLRMREDQRLYELEEDTSRKKWQSPVSVPDCPAVLQKFADEVARSDLQVSVAPVSEADRPGAQGIEDACYWALDELQQRHVRQLRSPFAYEVGLYVGLRGWVAATCLLAEDPADPFPWRVQLVDPIQVYPDTDDGAPGLVVHRYTTTYAALGTYWGRAALERATADHPYGAPRANSTPVTCYGFYTPTELGVLLDGGGWLKRPVAHGMGQLPVVIGVAPGAPYRSVDGVDTHHQALIGQSLLRLLQGVVKSKHEIAMILRRVLERTAAPPLFAALGDPKASADDVATEPNEITVGRPGDSVNPIVPPPVALQHATALLSLLQDSENRTGLPPQFWGDTPGMSGVDRTKALGSGMSVFLARLKTLQYWYQDLLRLMLRLYAEHGTGELSFLAVDRERGIRTAAGRLTPWDVQGAAARLEVRWGRLQHVDLVSMGNLAALLTDRGLVSHEYALGELLGVDNPTSVMLQARRDQFYKDPALLRLSVLFAKGQDVADPFGAFLAQQLLQSELQKFSLQAAGQPPAQPGPGPQQPPLPGVGLPQEVQPSGLGVGAAMPQAAAMLGSPQAGAGLQLVPPGFPGMG